MAHHDKVSRAKTPLSLDIEAAWAGKRDGNYDAEVPNGERERSFRRIIFSIPPGKVSTYGKVAAAAGYPRHHRAVARLLRTDPPDLLPWHRVLGAGGAIKLSGSAAKEQRARLKLEGIGFRGKIVNMDRFEHLMHPRGTCQ